MLKKFRRKLSRFISPDVKNNKTGINDNTNKMGINDNTVKTGMNDNNTQLGANGNTGISLKDANSDKRNQSHHKITKFIKKYFKSKHTSKSKNKGVELNINNAKGGNTFILVDNGDKSPKQTALEMRQLFRQASLSKNDKKLAYINGKQTIPQTKKHSLNLRRSNQVKNKHGGPLHLTRSKQTPKNFHNLLKIVMYNYSKSMLINVSSKKSQPSIKLQPITIKAKKHHYKRPTYKNKYNDSNGSYISKSNEFNNKDITESKAPYSNEISSYNTNKYDFPYYINKSKINFKNKPSFKYSEMPKSSLAIMPSSKLNEFESSAKESKSNSFSSGSTSGTGLGF